MLPLLPFPNRALHLTEPCSLTLSTTPNDLGLGLMGQVSVLERSTLHVDEGKWTHASIKEKICNLKAGESHWKKRTPEVNTPEPCMNIITKPPPGNHDLVFRTHSLQMILSGPIHVRTHHYCGSFRNVTLQYVCNMFKRQYLHIDYPSYLLRKIFFAIHT